jgi:ubiquinone/menaquinone biosynthesis C-methylase UbiE
MVNRWTAWLDALFWSLQSLTWDDYLALPEFRAEIEDTVRLLADGLTHGHSRVLDIGCGTGKHSLALAPLGCEVVGTDLSPGMLYRAREKADRAGCAGVAFRSADLNRPLPFEPGSFDGAIAAAVLQCAQEPVSFLREVRRVLAPQGLLLLVTVDSHSRPAAKLRLRATPLKWALRQIKALGNRSRQVRRYSGDQLQSMLAAAGFRVLAQSEGASTRRWLCQAGTGASSGDRARAIE